MTEVTTAPAAQVAVARGGGTGELTPWRLLLRRPTFIAGAVILLFWVVCAIFGHAIAPHDPLSRAREPCTAAQPVARISASTSSTGTSSRPGGTAR